MSILSKYLIKTISLTIYEVTLPSEQLVTVLLDNCSAREGVFSMFKDIFNKANCSPMIKIICKVKVLTTDAMNYQEALEQYCKNYKYDCTVKWYGSNRAYRIDSQLIKDLLTDLIAGKILTGCYKAPEENKILI